MPYILTKEDCEKDYSYYECIKNDKRKWVNCSEIIIDSSITRIGDRVFYNCRNLKNLKVAKQSGTNCLPQGIKEIGEYAFEGCKSLKSITIPDNVRIIKQYAFYDCENLKQVKIDIENSKLTSFRNGIFRNCKNLTSINIPDSIASIGQSAFESCEMLKNILSSNGLNILPNSITYIKKSAFAFSGIKTLTIPDNVETIERDAFASCPNLEFVELPKDLEIIKFGTFSDCPSLKSVILPENLTVIKQAAFYNCPKLETIDKTKNNKLPPTLARIETSAFEDCRKLKLILTNAEVFIGLNALKNVLKYSI